MSIKEIEQQIQLFINAVAASIAILENGKHDQHHVVACNTHFRNMFGNPSQLTKTTPFLLKDLIPRYNRLEYLDEVNKCFTIGEPLEFEQAYDLKEGTHWWRISLNPILDESSKVFRLLITGQDITRRIELEHKLKLTSSRFSSVIEAAYDCIITINQRGNIVLFNKAAQELFGYHDNQVLGKPITILMPERFHQIHDQHIDRFAQSPIRSRQMEERGRIYGRHQNGTEFPVEIAISKINVGGMVEFTAIVRDISEKIRLLDQLAYQASTDHLTGILNRRELEDRAQLLITHARQSGEPLSLLTLDIDKFKNINDTHGHDIGDEVLQLLSKVTTNTIHHLDIFARIGGDEFVVLMPETNKEQSIAMAERLLIIFKKQSFKHVWKGNSIPFTVSIGVTALRDEDSQLEMILKRADDALYQAKENGRNRVEFLD